MAEISIQSQQKFQKLRLQIM